jgi:hypothetical protein
MLSKIDLKNRVEFVQGDIACQRVDAIATDSKPRKKAGSELLRFRPSAQGRMVSRSTELHE